MMVAGLVCAQVRRSELSLDPISREVTVLNMLLGTFEIWCTCLVKFPSTFNLVDKVVANYQPPT